MDERASLYISCEKNGIHKYSFSLLGISGQTGLCLHPDFGSRIFLNDIPEDWPESK